MGKDDVASAINGAGLQRCASAAHAKGVGAAAARFPGGAFLIHPVLFPQVNDIDPPNDYRFFSFNGFRWVDPGQALAMSRCGGVRFALA